MHPTSRDCHPADNLAHFDLDEREFNALRSIVHEQTGIALSAHKMELVKRRFTPRLKALGLHDFGAYVTYLHDNFETEGASFCNAITTNLTGFFRESHHFDLLRNTIVPQLFDGARPPDQMRVWSAGCSTGQEAYSLAITLQQSIRDLRLCDAKILATDLDESCLATARRGIYTDKAFENVEDELLARWFAPAELEVKGHTRPAWRADPVLKDMITFNKLNLMQQWPMTGTFDLIMCRNVFIYFDKETQRQLVSRFAALQRPGAWLCLGHSEIIPDPAALGYRLLGKTAYLRIQAGI